MGRASGKTLGEAIRLTFLGIGVAIMIVVLTGPLRSGAIFLLLPTFPRRVEHDLPPSYRPLHKGHVDLSNGLYIREDEDLVVRGTPPLILRRTYLSRDHELRRFGIGTTHNGEILIFSTNQLLQQVNLLLGDVQIEFHRTSGGSSIANAMFEQRDSGDKEWLRARLGWTGFNWALLRPDGELMTFRPCGGGGVYDRCAITRWRDSDGHVITFERTVSGRLLRILADERWIAFQYDQEGRVSRAWSSAGAEVRYKYDEGGRLSEAAESNGAVHRYGYTASDFMATISEPDTTIENTYENERCVRQVNRFPDTPVPYVFEFRYVVKGNDVVQTDSRESDGTWGRYIFEAGHGVTSETRGADGFSPVTFEYQRDPASHVVMLLKLTCADRDGHTRSHIADTSRGVDWDWAKWDLVRTHCAPAPDFRHGP